MDRVTIYTDGSSRGNPGPGGYGAVLIFVDGAGAEHRLELSEGFSRTTNNRMEMMAAAAALEALKRPCEVELHSDSQYLVNAHEKGWIRGWQRNGWKTAAKKSVKNVDLWKRLIAAEKPHRVRYVWVKGHAGHELNERCDQLAVSAATGEGLKSDEGFSA